MERIESAQRRKPRLSFELAAVGFSVTVIDCALATLVKDPGQALIAIGAFTGATVGCTAALLLKRRVEYRRGQSQRAALNEDVAVLTLCQDGHILAANSAVSRIGIYDLAELVGQPFSRLFDDPDVQVGKPNQLLKAALTAGTFEDEVFLVKGDGSRFPVHVTVTARGSGFVLTITPAVCRPAQSHRDRRTDARTQTEEMVRVRVLGGSTIERRGRLLDVSDRGLGIELDQVITIGANVVIEWKNGFLVGTVRNCRRSPHGWEIGVELEPVPARHPMTSSLLEAAEERLTG